MPTAFQNSVARPSSERFCVGSLRSGRRLDHLELRLLVDLLLQEPVELALQVHVLEPLVARAIGVLHDEKGGERDLFVAAQREPRLQGELQADLGDAREDGGRGGKRNQQGESERRGGPQRFLMSHWRPFRSSGCRTCRTRRTARSCGGCTCPWGRARAPACTRRAPGRIRPWLPGRPPGCCAPARCSVPSRSPARIGRRLRARGPCWRPPAPKAICEVARPCSSSLIPAPSILDVACEHENGWVAARYSPIAGGYYRKSVLEAFSSRRGGPDARDNRIEQGGGRFRAAAAFSDSPAGPRPSRDD